MSYRPAFTVTAALLLSLSLSPFVVPTHTLAAGCSRISDIQGTHEISPCADQSVSNIVGIVTAPYYSGTSRKGFYMQDPSPANSAASSGILVYGANAGSQAVGDLVQVSGKVSAYRPGGSTHGELTVTEITGKVAVKTTSTGNALPPPVVIGNGGRIPPSQLIEGKPCGDIETCDSAFDPQQEGIDFWRILMGMRVQINQALVVGPTNQYYETVIVPDQGSGLVLRTPRGGAIVTATNGNVNFNPQRVFIANDIAKGNGESKFPAMNVGDTIPTVTGVLDYNFSDFRIELTQPITPTSGGLTQASATPQAADQLAIVTFNVQNFSDGVVTGKTEHLAKLVVNNLKSPDIVTVEEVQDNSGATDDGTVAADRNWAALINAITAAGGPTYKFTEIDPVNDQDGGQPGGNIRQGFLYNPARVSLISRPGGDSTIADSVTCVNNQAQLMFSPGRIDPNNPAWKDSRKPLAVEFSFNGRSVIVIGNHLVAKLADQPLFGQNQPPALFSEDQRTLQTLVINQFIGQLAACDPNVNVVVTGDLNDYQFSKPITTLAGSLLDNMMLTLPASQQYSYVFEGNSEVLDQILISHHLTQIASPEYEVVHLNAEFYNDSLPGAVRASDHDPSIVRLRVK